MSAKISSSENDVKNSETKKFEENLNISNVDDHKRFVKVFKRISVVKFKSKNPQISDNCYKLGKSILCVKHSIILIN